MTNRLAAAGPAAHSMWAAARILSLAALLAMPSWRLPDAASGAGWRLAAFDPAPSSSVPDVVGGDLTGRILDYLRALGLAAATDGVLDRATAASIRAYQGRHRLPVDGRPSRALLRHLAATVPVEQLQARLRATRMAQVAAARAALLAEPATGDWILGDILGVQVRAGESAAAFATMRRIADPRLVIHVLRTISLAQAEVGAIDDALATAHLSPIRRRGPRRWPQWRWRSGRARQRPASRVAQAAAHDLLDGIGVSARSVAALADLAAVLSAIGDADGATLAVDSAGRHADRAPTPAAHHTAAIDVMVTLAAMGRPYEAIDRLDAIAGEDARRPALGRSFGPTRGRARRSAPSPSSKSCASRATAPSFWVALPMSCFAPRGLRRPLGLRSAREAALAIDPALRFARDHALAHASRALADLGALAAAEATATMIGSARHRASALFALATARAEHSAGAARAARERAAALIEAMPSTLDQVWPWGQIAEERLADSDRDAAAEAVARAIDAARTVRVAWALAQALGRAAAALQALTQAGAAVLPLGALDPVRASLP